MSKILYIFDAADLQSRLPIAYGAKKKGYNVTIGLIGGDKSLGDFKTINLPKPSGALNSLSLISAVRKATKHEKPNILHAVTLKYAFICGLSSLFLKHKKIYTMAGLGYLFYGTGIKAALLQMLLSPLLILVLRSRNTNLIFQNPDDMELMKTQGYVRKDHAFLVRGSGVDLEKFNTTPEPQNETPLVLMPTRLVHEKGIDIFIEAAKILKNKGINAKFQIAGGETTHNPKAISAAQMKTMIKDSPVQWLGRVEDMPALLVSANLIVYPSHYGEGIPRVLLESCAAGRAIITTDHPGCREAVAHNENGILVPIKNPQATADAIQILLNDENKRHSMGKNSRARAESEFDINLIVKKTLAVYNSCR
ncbi:MAG: glycosyl transferase family 1 [Micavibrio sp.]|nr:MAG: glycosyl transferase family 1 [Micavibrio sp.]